jgi:2-(1,2-epoxy-1,2-dihydrophenyl)acetyl-CoA isomerase
MADYENILFDKIDHVGKITLNRPERLNAINVHLGSELLEALGRCEDDADVRCIILAGAGRSFCAGDDLHGMETPGFKRSQGPDAVKNYVYGENRWKLAVQTMRRLPKPVICSIRGHAHGGGFNLAMGADIRIVSETANFAIPFVKRGMATGVNQLDYHVGLGVVLEMAFTGEPIDAKRAERLGLVNAVVPDDQLEAATMAFAERLAGGPTRAIGLTKSAIYKGWGKDLDTTFDYRAIAQIFAAQTEDLAEGRAAFLEKRAPEFKGR